MARVDWAKLREVAEVEFADIVDAALPSGPSELRILLRDGSFIDVWFSLKLIDRYAIHWERRAMDGTIYRHDNAPHRDWAHVATFPSHFHDGSEEHVVEGSISPVPETALRQFLAFARSKLGHSDCA
ncbi:MAG: hypothetical protein HPY83_03505 [Anaerolineae bacterium]|nr:hypothetical protein [Anaerolineae bacterium]